MKLLVITVWYFIVYLGLDWQAPLRIVSIHGPYGERDRCWEVQRDHELVPGSLNKSQCFPHTLVGGITPL